MQRLGLLLTSTVFRFAATPTDKDNLCAGAGITDCKDKAAAAPLDTGLSHIIGTLLQVAGAVAVVIIIIGGITYVTSNGDAARVKQAKDTILYAVIGLIVAILAYAIVNYVTTSIS
jgi:type IV secretory pathway VirB2 component (pilin)